jgi:23S rRNA (adenine2030-N6)-methyltransferase
MVGPRSRYAATTTPDYSHRFHAGNVGDVVKHCTLVEILRRLAPAGRVTYLDTHAGDGRYDLAPTGEWREGIGRLWSSAADGASPALAHYLALCRQLEAGADRPHAYPGSPAFAAAVLGPDACLEVWERDGDAFGRLARRVASDPRIRATRGDGLAALEGALRAAEKRADAVVALVDPPWSEKADWLHVPATLARAARASRAASLVLWYPVKSLTRPNAMLARLDGAGIAGTAVELITTPLEQRRNRLNGSGVLLVRPPDGVVAALAATAPALGARCATVDGVWSFRVRSFRGSRG